MGTGVFVGGTAVLVGGTAVKVGGTAVAVGGCDVNVGGTCVNVGGGCVKVGGAKVRVALGGTNSVAVAPVVDVGPAAVLLAAALASAVTDSVGVPCGFPWQRYD